VVVKEADGTQERRRLQAERRWLERAVHPGVVLLADDPAPDRLTTRDVGGVALADLGRLPADEISGLGAASATVLADLHDLGIAHHAVTAEHLLVAADGSPVLCSFGRAGELHDGGAADVRGLASALADHVEQEPPSRLSRLLARADGRRPPTARGFARSLATATKAPRLPVGVAAARDRRRALASEPAFGRAEAGPAAPAGLRGDRPVARRHLDPGQRNPAGGSPPAQGGGGWAAAPRPGVAHGRRVGTSPFRGGQRLSIRRCQARRRVVVAAGAAAAVAAAALTVATVAGGAPPRPSPSCPRVDAGCRPVRLDDGTFVAGGRRWSLSGSGEVIVVGRWTCHAALPAVLSRPAGRVWVFGRWPGDGGRVAARLVSTFTRARSLLVVPGARDCDRLAVVGQHGAETVLPVGGALASRPRGSP